MKNEKSKLLPHTTRELGGKNPTHVVLVADFAICFQDRDTHCFIKNLIKETLDRYLVNIFQYAIQRGHIHLFLLTPIAHLLSQAMAFFNSKLALYFNRRMGRKGRFWVDRFFSSVKKSAREMIRTIHYIANQVAQLSPFENYYSSIAQAENYPWGIPSVITNRIGAGKSPQKLKDIILLGKPPYWEKSTRNKKVNRPSDGQLKLF